MRTASWAVLGGAFLLGGGATAALLPAAAAPIAGPLICRTPAPAADMSWADAIEVVPAGSVIRVADAGLSRADHATLLYKLGLLQGHLMVGRALIEGQQPSLALPHFGHPVREIYGDLKPAIARRGISPFDGELVSLEALAAGKPGDPAMIAQYDKVIRIVDALRATVPSELRDDERFTLGVVAQLANGATEDYGEAIEGGEITKPVEYDDARGYLMYAETELKRLDDRANGKPSVRLKAVEAKLAEMRAVVGPLVPPRKPIRSLAQFKALANQLKQAASASAT